MNLLNFYKEDKDKQTKSTRLRSRRPSKILAFASFMLALMAMTTASADTKVSWSLKKGDMYRMNFASKISAESGDRECKLRAILTIDKVKDGRASGHMKWTKLYAIRELSGSGARADKDKLSDFKVRFWLTTDGQLTVNMKDVAKIENKLEDLLEDIDLKSHMKCLSFKLPKKAIGEDKKWTRYSHGVTFEVVSKQKSDKIIMNGVTKDPDDSTVEVKGALKVEFNTDDGYLVSLREFTQRTRTLKHVFTHETVQSYKRELKFEKVTKADLEE